MLAAVGTYQIVVVVVYLMVVGYLGWLGYRRTQGAADYLVAGRRIHPFVMAMSYGATFISTSAIVGFGGVAGMFGMSLLWLTFLNIFVGIFIAFVFLGGPVRRLGHRLDAHTFPELLGRRFGSKFIQVFSGLVIFLFIPLYAAAVLIGGCEFIDRYFGIGYTTALLVFSVLIAAYVVLGGLKGVMYTDALQGTIMFIGMIILLVATYLMMGGVTETHTGLQEISKQPNLFNGIGFQGWTKMPTFGWGVADTPKGPNPKGYDLWWIVISTITLGVGIGVLAQPQLAVRFMTVRSKRELNRAALVGGVFILIMTGVAFTVGSVSNLWFHKHEEVRGRIIRQTKVAKVIAKKERDLEARIPCRLWHIDTDGDNEADIDIVANGYSLYAPKGGKPMPLPETPKAELKALAAQAKAEHGPGKFIGLTALMPQAVAEDPATGEEIDYHNIRANPDKYVGRELVIRPRATSFLRALIPVEGQNEWAFNGDSIIPMYITRAMPPWFGLLFLLTLLAAAMSTLSSQFHAVGTSIGRDVYEQLTGRHGKSISVTRIGIIIGIVIAVIISASARGGYIIARATAIFFGLCASAFLPALLGGLFFKRTTRAAVKWSMLVGFAVTAFWLVFIKDKEARALGICKALTGKHSLLLEHPNWPVVDPLVVALPLSLLVLIGVSIFTKPPERAHLDRCFGSGTGGNS